MMTGRPTLFDSLACDYDASFSNRAPAKRLREAVYAHIEPLIRPGNVVLEFGCGTGLDAVWFAEHGCEVWATDASPEMLRICRGRVARHGLQERVTVREHDLAAWPEGGGDLPRNVDLVFTDFGALNCVPDLRPFLATAHLTLRPGAFLAATVMGRFCLAETLYFALKLSPAKACRRWKGYSTLRAGAAEQQVWYHSPGSLLRLAEGFDKHTLVGIGALIPNSEAFGWYERSPRLLSLLARADACAGRYTHSFSDHYLLILKKSGSAVRGR